MTALVVTVTPTIMSGTVVRWHLTEYDAEHVRPIISASRERVLVHGPATIVPPDVADAAQKAHEALAADEDADMGHLATHRRRGLFGPLKPVGTSAQDDLLARIRQLAADIAFARIAREEARRTLLCHPDDVDRVRWHVDQLGAADVWTVTASQFVPAGQMYVVDEQSIEAGFRESMEVMRRGSWFR